MTLPPTSDLRSPTSSSASDNEVLVKVDGVSKKFCRDLKKSLWYGMKDVASELLPFGRKKSEVRDQRSGHLDSSSLTPDLRPPTSDSGLRPGEFWAVKDVSFELRRGECLGLIGHNGAGKTTLLKMLNGLIKPDEGTIEMRGRVGALIALGAGFNPILTGRENIHVNGSILGLTKAEVDAKIDDIIDFAEIREFIDTPVQSYSSGMQVRLGFSVASTLSPDILILDEVLAVGDIGFVIKCLNRVRQLAQTSAVIFVSHTMQFVSAFCTKVLVLERGETLLMASNPQEGITRYLGMLKPSASNFVTNGTRINHFTFHAESAPEMPADIIVQGCEISVDIEFQIESDHDSNQLRIYIDDEAQSQIIGYPIQQENGKAMDFSPGNHNLHIPLGLLDLNSGSYSFMVAIVDNLSKSIVLRKSGISPFRVLGESTLWTKIVRPAVPRP